MLNHLGFFFFFFCFFFSFFFLRLGLGQRRAVVIIGRWLLPSLVDTGDICCHYWQHILVLFRINDDSIHPPAHVDMFNKYIHMFNLYIYMVHIYIYIERDTDRYGQGWGQFNSGIGIAGQFQFQFRNWNWNWN